MGMSVLDSMDIKTAKWKLDKNISKQRTHMYKPIQIAEILHAYRIGTPDVNPSDLNTYRTKSKRWRNKVTQNLIGRVSTSSSKYQDDLFDKSAIPPEAITVLSKENNEKNGIVESYIYHRFKERSGMVQDVNNYIHQKTYSDFNLKEFLRIFNSHEGLRRSTDKIYEIIVYSLFYTVINYIDLEITLNIKNYEEELMEDFSEFNTIVLGLNNEEPIQGKKGNIYRLGSTNTADKGLDMWSNFGLVIQVKHLSLTDEESEEISDSLKSDQIIIACKSTEKNLINSLITQIGWRNKIQGIVTEKDLIHWYNLCFTKYQEELGESVLINLSRELEEEFPYTHKLEVFMVSRNYSEGQLTGLWSLESE